ncbi:MAG: hypothetical protein U5L45_12490 [Saprospiraceae bacterium]|nr:hypothetical protein [Saprospiraceae bacterium]
MDNNNNRLVLFQERLATEWYYRGMKQEDYARMNTKIPTATLDKKQGHQKAHMSPAEKRHYKDYLENLELLFRLLSKKSF